MPLVITEFQSMAQIPNGGGQMPQQPPLAEQTVGITGSSAQSLSLNPATRFVRLHTDAICAVSFGTSPTAVAPNGRMAANQTEYHGVPQGSAPLKIAVITST